MIRPLEICVQVQGTCDVQAQARSEPRRSRAERGPRIGTRDNVRRDRFRTMA